MIGGEEPGERLAHPFGRAIDRGAPLSFTFQGRRYPAFAGDTVASALWASGQRVLSRSFKYHRPRGPMSFAGLEANTLVEVDGEANVWADRTPVVAGARVRAQNYLGTLERDRLAVFDRLGRFLPAGFYYKAFFRPRGAWRYWQRLIRRAAGLGVVDPEARHGYYDKAYLFYDVVVIGGGPAGLAAAASAAECGAEVLLAEEQPCLGGALGYARFPGDPATIDACRDRLIAGTRDRDGLRVMTGATCTGVFADNWLSIVRGNRLHKVRAGALVVASGTYEQPMVFRNNDLPGVMLASGAQRLMGLYGVKPGVRAVLATANDEGYGAALDLLDAGVELACVVDPRPEPPRGPLAQAALVRHVPVIVDAMIDEAVPARGSGALRAARVRRLAGSAAVDEFTCDLIVTSVGYAPTANLIHDAGGRLAYDPASAMFAVASLPPATFAAGSVNGVHDLDATIADGRHQGREAARHAGHGSATPALPAPPRDGAGRTHAWPIFPHPRGREFVDFDEDIEIKDLESTVAEGYTDLELVKRFSTLGMGPSQGKHSGIVGARLAARLTEAGRDALAPTTSRPPYRAEKFAHLAGRVFEQERHTPMHRRHLAAGARMMPAGAWLRPAYYGSRDEREAAITREVLNARGNVGLIDVSTLGGLEVRGPDAAEFLERMYTFAYAKQPVGRCRYVLMTDRAGVVMDDGVAARLHRDRFYVTATTTGVDGVYRQMLWYKAQWNLDVDVTHVTAAYAAVNIAGPRSREVLAGLRDGLELSAAAFPYLGAREGRVAGIPALLLRVGFVGELGYEIHVRADFGEALWDALLTAGKPFGIAPFGVEAQRVLRLEKGHVIIGQDTDGLTTPIEADMAWAISRRKPYFVGKRSLEIQEARGFARKLVGFAIDGADAPLPEESHLVVRSGEITGRVTSCTRSPTLGKVIGLAYVAGDQAAPGGTFQIKLGDASLVEATVVPLPFYDPEGARQEL